METSYLSADEIEVALKSIDRLESELNVHERLILASFRKQATEEQKQVITHLLEKSQQYNNVIVAGSYTAFFAAWTLFRSTLQSAVYDLAFLSVLFSVLIFILWNVYSSFVSGKDLIEKAELLNRYTYDPMYLFKALNELNQELIKRALARRVPWYFALVLSAVPGIAGGATLIVLIGRDVVRRLWLMN